MTRTPIPRDRVPTIAAWLAARGRDLMTAPSGLVALAIEEPMPYWDPADRDRYQPASDEDTLWA